jgi:hypothetical protein
LGRVNLNNQFTAGATEALLAFNGEAVINCQGISDAAGHEYAISYARMLQDRVRGLEFSLPRIPAGLVEANRKLITENP